MLRFSPVLVILGRRLAAVLLIAVLGYAEVRADNQPEADQAWQAILGQASGPGNRFKSADEAMAAARAHLDKQESALREFIRAYPDDSRHYSAQIRLATVLAAKARVLRDARVMDNARQMLDDLERDSRTPAPIKADAGFARVSQSMQDASGGRPDNAARATLLQTVRQFDTAYPTDRRTGNLLAELSTIYDDDPAQKSVLLEEAYTRADDSGTKQRISDDLRRIAMLGKPVDFRVEPVDGQPAFRMSGRHGRAQVILFWASFSMPALHELAVLEKVSAQFADQPVDFTTVSLDEDRGALNATLKAAAVKWPTHYDGKGWTGEVVRDLGINSLPVVWVLDKKGQLTTLNARGNEVEVIRKALSSP